MFFRPPLAGFSVFFRPPLSGFSVFFRPPLAGFSVFFRAPLQDLVCYSVPPLQNLLCLFMCSSVLNLPGFDELLEVLSPPQGLGPEILVYSQFFMEYS